VRGELAHSVPPADRRRNVLIEESDLGGAQVHVVGGLVLVEARALGRARDRDDVLAAMAIARTTRTSSRFLSKFSPRNRGLFFRKSLSAS
jgi:hypothetical protein